MMRWGLVPSYNKAPPDFWRMFTARAETIDSLSSFSRCLGARRCAVPLDGWYEWTADECRQVKSKQPYYVHATDGAPVWLAGLHDCWEGPDGPVHTFTLITCDVSPSLAWLHDRMPVVLDAEALAAWLAPPGSASEPLAALRRCALGKAREAPPLAWHPVSKKISKLDHQAEDAAAAVALVSQQQRSVASFFGMRPTPPSAKEDAAEAAAASSSWAAVATSSAASDAGGGDAPAKEEEEEEEEAAHEAKRARHAAAAAAAAAPVAAAAEPEVFAPRRHRLQS
jgi:putative SOS response-associated peptidase YedK